MAEDVIVLPCRSVRLQGVDWTAFRGHFVDTRAFRGISWTNPSPRPAFPLPELSDWLRAEGQRKPYCLIFDRLRHKKRLPEIMDEWVRCFKGGAESTQLSALSKSRAK
jgi:hypothetical protein